MRRSFFATLECGLFNAMAPIDEVVGDGDRVAAQRGTPDAIQGGGAVKAVQEFQAISKRHFAHCSPSFANEIAFFRTPFVETTMAA
ncbi:MAG: hypothetical protein AAF264_11760 [Pseudomonadota bacterium]